mgnify:CR=1 FL=1
MAEHSTDRLVRMLGLVAYLDRKESVPVPELARHFGVSQQQIIKDVELLWVSGTPGYAPDDLIDFDYDQFERGVISVTADRGMRRPLRLGAREAIVLLSALEAVREVIGSGISPAATEVLDSAMTKLRAATGDAVEALDVHLSVGGDPRTRAAVGTALAEGRRLRIRYVSSVDVASEREVDPVRLFTDQGVTYLQGWCHRARAPRTFRLDRVLEASVLDVPAEDHELRRGAPESFRPAADDALVTLELAPSARWLAEQVPIESVEDLPDGSSRVALRIGDPAWLRALLLREALNVRSVSPASAAAPAAQAARAALEAYAALDAE